MDFDRDLSAKKDGITIEGEDAIWHNEWTAAGTAVQWNMTHYDVQLMGGAVLHKGNIAEMQTGEGKTLVATLPVYLNALAKKGTHVVTVNDYLAKRDSEWMGPLYQFHGLSVDCIDKHRPNSKERRAAYMADITFGTNNDFFLFSDICRFCAKNIHFTSVINENNIFRIASMTKALGSVAALQLVERGEITLDEPLDDYLPKMSSIKIINYLFI